MIRHIVMFKLKNQTDEAENSRIKEKIKSMLEALPAQIEVIRSMEVGINVVMSDRAFDLVLVSSFDSLEDLETYRVHPAHQEVVNFISGYKERTAAVDFEY